MRQETTSPNFSNLTQEEARVLNAGAHHGPALANPSPSLEAEYQWLRANYQSIKHERDMLSKALRVFNQNMIGFDR